MTKKNENINVEPDTSMAESAGAHSSHLTSDSQETQTIPLEQIHLTDDYRFRLEDDGKVIDQYAEMYRQYLDDIAADERTARCPLPPVHVLRENDEYHVVSGRHRRQAAYKAGLKEMPCIVLTDRAEAIQMGLGSNRHGLPLNHEDKKHCIKIAISEFGDWSNRRIADIIGCSSRYVDRVVDVCELRPDTHVVKGKDGKTYPAHKNRNKIQPQDNVAKDTTDAPKDKKEVPETHEGALLIDATPLPPTKPAVRTPEEEFKKRMQSGEFDGTLLPKNTAKIRAVLDAMEECSHLFQENFELMKAKTEEYELRDLLLLANLRCTAFKKAIEKVLTKFSPPSTPTGCPSNQSGIQVLITSDGSYKAQGRPTGEGKKFMVLEGSTIKQIEIASMSDDVKKLRAELELQGVIKDFTFMKDYTFDSPSQAASFIVGSNVQGSKFWKAPEMVNDPVTPAPMDSGIDAVETRDKASLPNGGKRVIGNTPEIVPLTPPPSRM